MEILRIQEDAVPENTKMAMKFGLKVSKDRKNLPTFNFRAASGNDLGNYRFHQSKQTRPPSCSSLGIGRNKYHRVLWQKH